MSELTLRADATFGLKVKLAEIVQPGRQLGINPDTAEPLLCPVSAIVENISFNPENHTFEILLRTD